MEATKLKNLIIITLVIVNLFFAALVASDQVASAGARQTSLREAEALLERRGIAVAQGARLGGKELNVLAVERDLKAENRHISNLLGRVESFDLGGNIINYVGEHGQAVFRGSGGFEILFNDGVIPIGTDAENTARYVARKLGIDIARGDGSAVSNIVGEGGTVELYCAVNGVRVIGGGVTFTFNSGSLILVGGTRPLDRVDDDAAAETFDLPTVLMRFLESITAEGHVCGEVRGAEMCYTLSSSASGKGLLIPVWRIETDVGDFYINGLTGRAETIS